MACDFIISTTDAVIAFFFDEIGREAEALNYLLIEEAHLSNLSRDYIYRGN